VGLLWGLCEERAEDSRARRVRSKAVVYGTFRDWLERKATRAEGSARPDYESRFIRPERLFAMNMGQISIPAHEDGVLAAFLLKILVVIN
jgi:hypothetical protein